MFAGKLSYALRCCADSLDVTEPDSLGHVFCHLNCSGCNEKNFCLSVKRVVEEELNRRRSVQEILDAPKRPKRPPVDMRLADRHI